MAVYQSLTLTQVSQDAEQNTSQVRILWRSTQTGSSYNMIAHDAQYWISVNSQPEQVHTVTYYLPQNSTHSIVDTVVTVPHNDKGEAVLQVRTWMNTRLSVGVVELNRSLTLDNIPRASTVLASDALIGGFSRLAVTKRNSGYTHSIAWQFEDMQGYVTENGGITQEETVFSADSVDFQIPDVFYEAIPNARNGICTLTISTYDNGSLVGQPQTAAFTASVDEAVCCPVVAGSVRDINEVTLALTGDERKLVRGHSTALCQITASARKGASVTKKLIQAMPVQEDTLTLSGFGAEAVRFEMEDSRGFTASFTKSVELIPYVELTCDGQAVRDDPVSGNATLYILGDCYAGSFGAADNEITLCYSIDGVEPVTMEASLTEDHRFYASAALTGMDYTRVYSITVWVSDRLSSLEKRVTLKKGVPVFDWGEGDFAFHVPVHMDSPLSLKSGGTGAGNAENARVNLGLSPEMLPGTEYTTWEKWQGKTVYTKLLEFGNLPDNGCREAIHFAPATSVLRCSGCLSDGRTLPFGGSHTARAEVFCDTQKVYIDTNADFSGVTAVVKIDYLKD